MTLRGRRHDPQGPSQRGTWKWKWKWTWAGRWKWILNGHGNVHGNGHQSINQDVSGPLEYWASSPHTKLGNEGCEHQKRKCGSSCSSWHQRETSTKQTKHKNTSEARTRMLARTLAGMTDRRPSFMSHEGLQASPQPTARRVKHTCHIQAGSSSVPLYTHRLIGGVGKWKLQWQAAGAGRPCPFPFHSIPFPFHVDSISISI